MQIMILCLIFTFELLLGPDHDLKTCSLILICRPCSKSHKINFGATSNPSVLLLIVTFSQVGVSTLLLFPRECCIHSLGRRAYNRHTPMWTINFPLKLWMYPTTVDALTPTIPPTSKLPMAWHSSDATTSST